MTKPHIKIFRYEGEIWYRCDTENGVRVGVGKTPIEAYDAWFEDEIPFNYAHMDSRPTMWAKPKPQAI